MVVPVNPVGIVPGTMKPLEPQAFYVVTPVGGTVTYLASTVDADTQWAPRQIDQTWTWRQVHMLGQDRLPVGEQVFELAPRAPPRLSYYGTEWRQVHMLGKDRLPAGQQVYDLTQRPIGRGRAWELNLLTTTLAPTGVVQNPFYQLDWPLPRAPGRIDETWTWNQLPMLGQDTLPENQYDWPLPRTPKPIDQTWVWNQVRMLGQDFLLAGEQVYDLTPKASPRLPFYSWEWNQLRMLGQDRLLVGKQVHELVPSRFVPFRPDETWTWRQVGMLGRDVLLVGDQVYDLPPKSAQRLPYYGTEWRQVQMLGQDYLLAGHQVYDRPMRGPLRAIDLYTWIQSVNLALTVIPPVGPLGVVANQYDWPLPKVAQQPTLGWAWRQVDKIGRDVLPRNQYDWPLPRSPFQFNRGVEWRQTGMLGRDRLPTGQQIYDRPIRGARLAIYDWIQSVNLALTVIPPALPKNQFDWPLPRGAAQPDRGFTFRSQFIPAVAPFVGAQYFLLQPHYINDHWLDAWTTVTEGHEVPVGWIPTLMVDPLNSQAVSAFYAAGPRPGYPGPGYDWQAYQGFTARRTAAIQSPITHWREVSPGMFQLTGLGAALPPVGV